MKSKCLNYLPAILQGITAAGCVGLCVWDAARERKVHPLRVVNAILQPVVFGLLLDLCLTWDKEEE